MLEMNCDVVEDSWESLRDSQGESNQYILKEISPEYSLEGLLLMVKLLWPPDAKNWIIGGKKTWCWGKDWRQKEKGMTEDEMVGWHHQLDEHEFEKALEVGNGQGSLPCCSPWGCKESDTTERLNDWTSVGRNTRSSWRFENSKITHKCQSVLLLH